jgi:hypothetical protein
MWFRAFGQQIRGKLREEDGSTKRIRALLDSLDEATADVAALRYARGSQMRGKIIVKKTGGNGGQ